MISSTDLRLIVSQPSNTIRVRAKKNCQNCRSIITLYFSSPGVINDGYYLQHINVDRSSPDHPRRLTVVINLRIVAPDIYRIRVCNMAARGAGGRARCHPRCHQSPTNVRSMRSWRGLDWTGRPTDIACAISFTADTSRPSLRQPLSGPTATHFPEHLTTPCHLRISHKTPSPISSYVAPAGPFPPIRKRLSTNNSVFLIYSVRPFAV